MSRNERGSMLVVALWALTILTIFSISLGFGVRQKAALLDRIATLDALYPIAYSGVEKARSLLREDGDEALDTLTDPWAHAGTERFSNGSFSYVTDGTTGMVDEERKINLNKMGLDIAVRLFKKVSGLPESAAEELVYNLQDWMDSDSGYGHAQYGAEDSYYEGLERPYSSKDAPYEVLDEMLLVKGMTPALYKKLRPYVTVYGTGRINLNTASAEVLEALGFSPQGLSLMIRYRSGEDKKMGTSDDGYFTDLGQIPARIEAATGQKLDSSQTVLLDGLNAAGRIGVGSTCFSVTTRAELKSGETLEARDVIDRKGHVLYHRYGEVVWPRQT